MTVLKGKKCYLSGPIEFDTPGHNWRWGPKTVLTERYGIDLFDPFADPKQIWVGPLTEARSCGDLDAVASIAKNFVRKDLALVDRADFLVAFVPHKVPTTGTVHEVVNAVNAKKPVLLVSDKGKGFIPAWYFGFVPHTSMFGSWEELYKHLDEVEAGLHRDNDRWHYIYGMV